MANITVSLDESAEKKLRELADEKYDGRKGSMAKVIAEAVEMLSAENDAKSAAQRQAQWMKKGFKLGKINFSHRAELYGRK
ncbi:MAG: hypothetical protein HY394_03480 [Candidatus Diapherotrites archaeon]|nr:hypothetical protein [Candidatus Diapherotrites archaeon]